tara:strand:+ start:9 stop:1127 length:1119 start_codon:yes stop_codon:yes gene_type:complete
MDHKLKKYINNKLADSKWIPHKSPSKKKYDFLITIPCYDELDYIKKTLESISKQSIKLLNKTLISVTINNSNKENKTVRENNQKTYEELINVNYNFELIIIDAYSKEKSIEDKNAGVGMARKISVDACLNYIHPDSLISFIDADTTLSKNYLSRIHSSYKKNGWEGATVDFEHDRDFPETIELINEYENFLKTTASKIAASGSPYNYVPLGSTMVCTFNSYIAIGGMNRKKAAEDFYFLQELEKYSGVHKINEVLVHPSSRYLNRTYLGTSTRLKKCMDGELEMKSFYYSDAAFNILNKWLSLALSSREINCGSMLNKASKINSELKHFLIDHNINKSWDSIISAPSNKHFTNQFHRWFDGFKTLKLLKLFS